MADDKLAIYIKNKQKGNIIFSANITEEDMNYLIEKYKDTKLKRPDKAVKCIELDKNFKNLRLATLFILCYNANAYCCDYNKVNKFAKLLKECPNNTYFENFHWRLINEDENIDYWMTKNDILEPYRKNRKLTDYGINKATLYENIWGLSRAEYGYKSKECSF